jgi:hypothetical protein
LIDLVASFKGTLDHRRLSDETLEVPIARRRSVPEDDRELRFLLYLGMADLLAEAIVEAASNEEEAVEAIAAAVRQLDSTEAVLRFELFDRSSRANRQEVASRMRRKEIEASESWMIPRLREDIELYRRRIAALLEAFGERS